MLQKMLSWFGHAPDAESSRLGKLLSNDPPQQDIPLARQGELPATVRLRQGNGGEARSGSIVVDGSPLAWREFAWGEYAKSGRHWHSLRWRFYENGHVCFDARMSNSSKGVDLGHLQGHRIELRATDGLLIGVFACGFFVRRMQPVLGFQSDIMDSHATLKMHFADLAEEQTGFWLYRLD